MRRAFECFARALFSIYIPIDVSGRELLPDGPFVLCSNHSSHLDGTALIVATGLSFDRFRLLAAADYFELESTAGRLTRAVLHIIPVDRTEGHAVRLRRTVSECAELVRTQPVRLIAFPEGTRSATGGMSPFKGGSAFLAVTLGLPIVPAYIEGTRALMPKGRSIPHPGRIRVRFGRPIRPPDWSGVGRRKARWAYVTRELEQRITELGAL
jgi:1-acyl-sn-glycerol-3-phosphate acyltransferase/long-chain acyl-CoA synthetase